MPDLLREQWPYFKPIVEAFGYRNLEFEGWEADDVIATLATRADEAELPTCVVSTGPRRAPARHRERLPDDDAARRGRRPRVHARPRDGPSGRAAGEGPDLIGLKGDTSDSIAGVPGIGDKTAAQLIQQFDSVEGVLEHVDELSPARARSLREHADQARESKVLATMRRDLDIDCDPGELVLAPPDRSELQEMFRRFEFRALLQRIDQLDEALPAAERPVVAGEELSWREGELGSVLGRVGLAADGERCAVAEDGGGVVVLSTPCKNLSLGEGEIVAHDAKPLRVSAVDDTLLAAYLIEPGRTAYELPISPPSTGSRRSLAARRGGDGGARPPRSPPVAPGPLMRARLAERDLVPLYENTELPLTGVLARMEDAGVKIDTYRMGEITARLRERVEELEGRAYELAGEEFMLGSTQQVARALRAAGVTLGARGRRATPPTRASCRRSATSTRSCP